MKVLYSEFITQTEMKDNEFSKFIVENIVSQEYTLAVVETRFEAVYRIWPPIAHFAQKQRQFCLFCIYLFFKCLLRETNDEHVVVQ